MSQILIVSGDPNSINSEIIYKVWRKLNKNLRKKIYIISNYKLLEKQFKKLNFPLKMIKVKNLNQRIKADKLKVMNIDLDFTDPFRVTKKNASHFFIKSLNYAHNQSIAGNINGFINCPINKKLLKNKGVTEYLAKKCLVKDNSEVMLISNKNFSVCPITTHVNVKSISKNLTKEKIVNKVITINKWFIDLKKKKPKIAILGLNPHNAEHEKNSEENKIIQPAVKKIKKLNINISGPYSSDTFFINQYKQYDVAVGMYHDQVITPFKTLFGFDAINITLGLKYIRISPDHGVAENLVKKNKANPLSLLSCIKFLNKLKNV